MPGKGDAINEKYVNMGKFCISFDFLNDIWDEELALMNKDKVGRPYLYPESFIRFVATIRTAYGLRYRQTEGFLRAISEHSPKIRPADYTTIWRRTLQMKVELSSIEDVSELTVILDSTGFKMTDAGSWINYLYGKNKNYLKAHAAIDAKTGKLIGIVVTGRDTHDSEMGVFLVEGVAFKVLIADGAYDKRDMFNLVAKKNAVPIIKIRKNASTRSLGSPLRARSVREVKKIGQGMWKEKYEYGRRWRIESYFSAVKRSFGEGTTAKRFDMAQKEVMMKFLLYDQLQQLV